MQTFRLASKNLASEKGKKGENEEKEEEITEEIYAK